MVSCRDISVSCGVCSLNSTAKKQWRPEECHTPIKFKSGNKSFARCFKVLYLICCLLFSVSS